MAEHPDLWRTEPDGVLATEVGAYRLTVQAPGHAGGWVRFLVLRHDGDEGGLALIGSGMKADRRKAMTSARRMADRLIEPPSLLRDRPDRHAPHDAIVVIN